MTAKHRYQETQRRNRDRSRAYLYGADREGAMSGVASFAGGGSGGVACCRL